MQGLILASGIGKRMGEITKDLPKCLIPLSGKPLLEYILESFRKAGVREVVIVVGYRKERIKEVFGSRWKGLKIVYVDNPRFATQNNGYTLWCARDAIKGAFIQCHGDVALHPGLISEVKGQMRQGKEDGVVADPDPAHFVEDGNRVIVKGGRVIDINKKAPPEQSSGRAFGIYIFSAETARAYFRHSGEVKEDPESTFEWPLREVFKEGRFKVINTTLPYAEVDEPWEMAEAERETAQWD